MSQMNHIWKSSRSKDKFNVNNCQFKHLNLLNVLNMQTEMWIHYAAPSTIIQHSNRCWALTSSTDLKCETGTTTRTTNGYEDSGGQLLGRRSQKVELTWAIITIRYVSAQEMQIYTEQWTNSSQSKILTLTVIMKQTSDRMLQPLLINFLWTQCWLKARICLPTT